MAISWDDMNDLQPRVMRLIFNSIDKDRLAHAYLFEGKKVPVSRMLRCFGKELFA